MSDTQAFEMEPSDAMSGDEPRVEPKPETPPESMNETQQAEEGRAAAASKIAKGVVSGRGGQSFEKPLDRVTDAASYEAVKPGAAYMDPQGTKRTKPYSVSSSVEYEDVPEGADYKDPEGQLRTKPKYEGVDFTAQTLFDIAVNDKERQKSLERSYPGKVKRAKNAEGKDGDFFVEDEGGVLRKPGHGPTSVGGYAAASAAPVLASIAGSIGGAFLGNVPGAVAGAAVGGIAGQSFNDGIMALAGVYDRSLGEQAMETGLAGAFGAGGEVAGRGIAAAAPFVKGKAAELAPKAFGKFLGVNQEKLPTAIALREQGLNIPTSPVYEGAPHVANIAEVFIPALDLSRVASRAAERHMEKKGGELLEGMGVKDAGSLVKPEAAVPTEKAGVTLLNKAREELVESDARLARELELAKMDKTLQVHNEAASAPTREALAKAWDEQDKAARAVIQQGFEHIQTDVDAAMKMAKAGNNSADLWWNVGEKFRQLRQGIATRAKKMYADADALAGAHLPNSQGLSEVAQRLLDELPEGFKTKYTGIVNQLRAFAGEVGENGEIIKEAVEPTFGQLHNLRSDLRSGINYLDLTPDQKQGAFKLFAGKVDDILHDVNAVPELRDAARALDKTDAWYREQMGPFNDRRIQAVVDGLEAGLPADPKLLFDTLVKEGRSALTKKAAEMVGPNLWAGVKAADVQSMLDESKTLIPGQIDGKRFVAQVEDRVRSGMLEAVHGKEASEKLLSQARNIAMLEGKLPVSVKPGDTVTDIIAKARAAADEAKAAAKSDPLGTLQKEMKAIERDAARKKSTLARERKADKLGFLYEPTTGATQAVDRILGSEDMIIAAAAKFGETSKEFEMLRQIYAQRVLQSSMQPSEALAKMSPEVQQIMFPGVSLDAMKQLAKDMDFLMGGKGRGDMAAGMSGMAKVEHPWTGPLGAVGKYVPKVWGIDTAARATLEAYYKFVYSLVAKPAFMRWLQKGLKGDEAAREQVRQTVQRMGMLGGAMGAGGAQAERMGNFGGPVSAGGEQQQQQQQEAVQ